MSGLVLFLPGLGGNANVWGGIPDHIRNSELGKNFDVALLQYSAKLRSPSDITTSARRILTDIETDYPDQDPIYIIGYSLGGLIARELSKILLEGANDSVLVRIAAVVTVGTPLEGAGYLNIFLRHVPGLPPKLRQLADTKFVFDDYRSAIRTSIPRRVSRPRQIHLQMEDDGVISAHVKERFTEDDREGGVIFGTHTNFAKTNTDALKAANVLLQQIRKTENSFGRQYVRKFGPVAQVELPDRLVLIACSHNKREGGDNFEGPVPAG